MKTCSSCKDFKSLDSFHKDAKGKGKLSSQCKSCKNKKLKVFHLNNPKYRQNSELKFRYNITINDYNQLLIDQNGCCAICLRHQKDLSRTLAVDHSHISGKIRGLLCDFCNRQLGVYEKQRDLFNKFDDYLNINKTLVNVDLTLV